MNSEHLYLPLFPLPNVVFYPRTLLPLHIFEPRYCQMIESVLAGDRLMGVGLLKPGWESAYYDAPAVYNVCGMGKVIEHEKLENGNYNIWLSGIDRCKIVHEVQDRPFRVAKVNVLRDGRVPGDVKVVAEARRELTRVTHDLARVCPSISEDLRKSLDEQVYPGALADVLADLICADTYEKQCILSENSLTRRLQLVTIQARRRFNLALAEHQARKARRSEPESTSAES